jgi:TRAP transporter TAXI family solute receptor
MKRILERVSLRDLVVISIPLTLLVAGSFWLAYQFVRPAPSDRLIITTGPAGGAYQSHASRYREIISRNRVEAELRPSSGSVENLQRLATDATGVDAGLVQGGIASPAQAAGLVSLGSLYYEPLWIFYRDAAVLDRLSQLKGKRLAIGPEGSGVRQLALRLLSAHEIGKEPNALLDLPISETPAAMRRDEIDAGFVVAGP